jgi:superfamily II DNA or RNA helicase
VGKRPLLLRSPRAGGLRTIIGEINFGYPTYATASLPDRVFVGLDSAERPPSVQLQEPAVEVTAVRTPLEYLLTGPENDRDAWPQETRRAVARLEVLWLLMEDRHRLLDSQLVEPLAHQASLVHHILEQTSLLRVLIADEVGLGKTIEAGLIIKRLIEASPERTLRFLYLSPARLVDNVVEEFEKMGLTPRRWTSTRPEARLSPGDSDPLVIASMHRAVYRSETGVNHLDTMMKSGPWDGIIVDEAHHLTDYSVEGSDPGLKMRLVRQIVKERLSPGGRVVLMTGTPHQGHAERFRNLLALLDASGGGAEGARGRVIYRTKEDILDWDKNPLFPVREVREPTVVQAGPRYGAWLRAIHAMFSQKMATRAAKWRRAQALQWAASSPQAGLAYLVRMAIRSGMSSSNVRELRAALEILRPYRGGTAQETPEALEKRLEKRDPDSDEESDEPDGVTGLASLIAAGTALVRDDAFADKVSHVFKWLDEAPAEKFVIFAQPIETVYALRARIEQHLGAGSTALIVGDQPPATREAEIRRFREEASVRVLVSSKAGGEGINLQVSRRLIHFDVPWNPMEMEQRVGRIHRFGSLQTVIVETLVLDSSREQRVLERCRARLGQIVKDLDRDRFSVLYARTLSLIPMDDLADLMAGEDFGPLTASEADRLDHLVTAGYQSWVDADKVFRNRAERIETLERGVVGEDDLNELLVNTLGAELEQGWRQRGFETVVGQREPQLTEHEAHVLRLPDGSVGYIGTTGGVGLVNNDRAPRRPRRLGLNDAYISSQVRLRIGEGSTKAPEIRGAGVVMVMRTSWRDWVTHCRLPAYAEGAILLAYVRRQIELRSNPFRELGAELILVCSLADGNDVHTLLKEQGARLLRLIRKPRPKRTRPARLDPALLGVEQRIVGELMMLQPGEPAVGVFPIAALWIEPTDE